MPMGQFGVISNGRLQLNPALNRHFRGLAPDSMLKPHSNFKPTFSRFGSRRLLKRHLRGFDATGRSSFKPTFPRKKKKIRASGRRRYPRVRRVRSVGVQIVVKVGLKGANPRKGCFKD